MSNLKNDLWVGVDVGSTTVKIAVVDPETNKLLHYTYQRHNAMQAQKVFEVLREAHGLFPDKNFRVAFCGSGGQPFAEPTPSLCKKWWQTPLQCVRLTQNLGSPSNSVDKMQRWCSSKRTRPPANSSPRTCA